ncbi:hypothetical protein [Listeria seeligeri]|uniref:hypothetical protein n=1 Tax=Listeria seeligeri TaxID=1640 RepID=UPI00188892D1|nr:hypothetical protein [Listeria seeligeri]MBF2544092.1 hypothetical protein [Listeria seeligeri]MBF2642879.1 hypothetical protein [Listeria seeligeri]
MKLKIGRKIIIKEKSKQALDNTVYRFILENPAIEFEHELMLKRNIFGQAKWILKIEITKI